MGNGKLKTAESAKAPLALPKSSKLILRESTEDRLEIRTRSEFSWIYLVTMVAIVTAFVGDRLLGRNEISLDALGFAAVLFVTFAAFTAFQSLSQWMRIVEGQIEYQLRLWSIPLTRKRARLAEIEKIEIDDGSEG